MQRITDGIPALIAQSRSLGVVSPDEPISLSLVLPLRNEAALDALLASL